MRDLWQDLKLPNHFTGHDRLYLQLGFLIYELLAVRCNMSFLDSAKRGAVGVDNATAGTNRDIWRANSTNKISTRERDEIHIGLEYVVSLHGRPAQ